MATSSSKKKTGAAKKSAPAAKKSAAAPKKQPAAAAAPAPTAPTWPYAIVCIVLSLLAFLGLFHAEGDNAGGAVEKGNELTCPDVIAQADELGHHDGDDDTEPRAALGAVILLGAEVLTHERGAGHREARDGQKGEAFDLAVRAVGRHREHAERVDLRLDDDVGKADDAVPVSYTHLTLPTILRV